MTSLRAPLRLESVLAQSEWLRRLAHSLVARRDLAEDVIQETLLVALRREGELVRHLRPWLARVVHNIVRRISRRDRMRWRVESHRTPGEAPDTLEVVAEAEMQQRVFAAVLALAEPYRSTILLRFRCGLSYEEVSGRMGVPVETVRTRIKRGLKRVRRELRGENADALGALISVLIGGGGVVMKKSIALALVLAVGFLFAFWPSASKERDVSDPGSNGEELRVAVVERGADEVEIRSEKGPAVSSTSASTGSLRVRVVDASGASVAGAQVVIQEMAKADRLFRMRRFLTGDSGVVVARELAPGRFRISTCRSSEPESLVVEAGREASCMLTLVGGLEVRGTVVTRDGTPFSGARIHMGRTGFRAAATGLTSDEHGRFSIRHVASGSEVFATAEHFAPTATHMILGKNSDGQDQAVVSIRLELSAEGGGIEGRVEGPEGNPMVGAVIQAGAGALRRNLLPNRRIESLPRRTRSAADGTFRFRGLATGPMELVVRAEGHGPASASCEIEANEVQRVVVRLGRGVVCEGFVHRADGAPAPEAIVEVGRYSGSIHHSRVETDQAGAYRLSGLAPGTIELSVSAGELGRVTDSRRASDGELVRCDFVLPQQFTLTGRVLTERGDPLVGATIGVTGDRGERRSAKTLEGGWFHVKNCPELARVVVSDHDFTLAKRDRVRPADGPITFKVAARSDSYITGRVLGSSGQPLVGATILSVPRRPAQFRPYRTGADGRFKAGPIPEGWYRLLVAAPSHARHYVEDHYLVAGRTWDVGTVTMARGGQVAVDVGAAEGGVPETVQLVIVDAHNRRRGTVRLKRPMARSGTLPPGSYRLCLLGPGIAAQSLPFVIREGKETTLRVRTQAGVRCGFRLLVPDVVGEFGMVRLSFRGRDRTIPGVFRTRRKGAFDYEYSLAPGDYTVVAESEAGHRGEQQITVRDQSDQKFELRLR